MIPKHYLKQIGLFTYPEHPQEWFDNSCDFMYNNNNGMLYYFDEVNGATEPCCKIHSLTHLESVLETVFGY